MSLNSNFGFWQTIPFVGGCGTVEYSTGGTSSIVDMTFSAAASMWRKYVIIIPAADFSATAADKRTVTDITLSGFTSNTQFDDTFKIYIRNTPYLSVSSGGNDISASAENYSLTGGITCPFNRKFTLSTPMTWDGTSNLMVIVLAKSTAASLTPVDGFYRTSTTIGYSWGAHNSTNQTIVKNNVTAFSLSGLHQVYCKVGFSC